MHKALGSTPAPQKPELVCWHMLVIPALKKWRREHQKFEVIPSYIWNKRPPELETLSQKEKTERTNLTKQ